MICHTQSHQSITVMSFQYSYAIATAFALTAAPALAHFQELIPTIDDVTDAAARQITLDLTFTHPMARGPVMPMKPPVRYGVIGPNGSEDLLPTLTAIQREQQPAFTAQYTVKQPGDYVFFIEPTPYWEPAEQVFIIHYTKVVVGAYGAEDGWDRSVNLPVEIIPLTRPYGLWTGNVMRGIVKHHGQPVPFATIEVEWRNDGSIAPPADPFITQVIKTDANGVFVYAMPRAGWWGFAALITSNNTLPNPDGKQVPVELGGLLWVRTHDFPKHE